jgi:hypothetical protein
VAGFCKRGDEPSGPIMRGEVLDYSQNKELL